MVEPVLIDGGKARSTYYINRPPGYECLWNLETLQVLYYKPGQIKPLIKGMYKRKAVQLLSRMFNIPEKELRVAFRYLVK